MNLISPAGGLYYHLKALRYRREHWQHFVNVTRTKMRPFVLRHTKKDGPLLLIGPSAGYCLPIADLQKTPIIACEPDPLARYLLKRKLPQITFTSMIAHPKSLELVISTHQPRATIFCNFLGQLPFILTDHQLKDWYDHWINDFARILNHKAWFSFHDIAFSNNNSTIDLPTYKLFENLPHKNLGHALWQITPQQTQLIEFMESINP